MIDSININVEHVARLARLEINEKETERFTTEIGEILNYVKELSETDTEGVEPITQISGLKNVFRDDEIKDSLANDLVLKNAPVKQDGFIKVKQVFE